MDPTDDHDHELMPGLVNVVIPIRLLDIAGVWTLVVKLSFGQVEAGVLFIRRVGAPDSLALLADLLGTVVVLNKKCGAVSTDRLQT